MQLLRTTNCSHSLLVLVLILLRRRQDNCSCTRITRHSIKNYISPGADAFVLPHASECPVDPQARGAHPLGYRHSLCAPQPSGQNAIQWTTEIPVRLLYDADANLAILLHLQPLLQLCKKYIGQPTHIPDKTRVLVFSLHAMGSSVSGSIGERDTKRRVLALQLCITVGVGLFIRPFLSRSYSRLKLF